MIEVCEAFCYVYCNAVRLDYLLKKYLMAINCIDGNNIMLFLIIKYWYVICCIYLVIICFYIGSKNKGGVHSMFYYSLFVADIIRNVGFFYF